MHNRKSIRLKGFDYSSSGYYFVTICTTKKIHWFGKIIDNKFEINQNGLIIKNELFQTEKIRKNVKIDKYQIMPNHIHAIIIINNTGADAVRPYTSINKTNLGKIISGFKSSTHRLLNKANKSENFPFWQRNYFERIIRDKKEYWAIKTYIKNNPQNWPNDTENIH